jgi:cell division protein FtsQ
MARGAEWLHAKTLSITADAGFTVQNIMVEGRKHADVDTIKAIVNVQKGDPLFSFRPAEAQEMIEKIAWVRSAQVERRLPDTIYIRLEERLPMALWQREGKVSVIDDEGVVLTDHNPQDFRSLLLVAGEEAPTHAAELLSMLEAEPSLGGAVESATFVSGRRWDLKMKNGTAIKLPEDEVGLALRRLVVTQEQDHILDKNLSVIDLREADRITVRTKPGAVQEYKAGYATTRGGSI